MTDSIATKKTSYLIKRFIPYFKKYKWILVFDLFCAMLTSVCDLVLPLIVRYITNMGINDIESLSLQIILALGSIYFVLRIIDVAANYYMANVGHVMGARIETDMRKDLFAHMQELSYSYYSNTKIGQLMGRITSDLFDITEFAHHCPEEYFIGAFKIIVSFIILCSVNVWLTLIIFAILPLMIIFSMFFRKKMRNAFKKQRNQIGEVNSQVEDSLLGIRVSKSFANEEIEKAKFEKGNMCFFSAKKEAYKYVARFQGTIRAFDGLMYIAVVIVGSIFMINGKINPSDLVAYLLYVVMLLNAVRRIVEFTEKFQSGITGLERFIEVMDEPIEIDDIENAIELPAVKGDISFKDVSFKYFDSDNILEHININIKAGENVAFVGPSGSGKTTLCNLIPRFFDVTSGKILVDGFDIRNVNIKSLRTQIGVVQQDVYLFSGSVYENIEYGRPGASREEVEEAAKLAGAHGFISQLPQGYHTFVGEHGVKLSGGQKQRISIARVFLKNPPILILDEATSALDNESEMIVQESLAKLAKGRTTLTIAHRLTTIRNATKIMVLTDNGIEEQGSHEELIAKNGIYFKLYSMYER